MVSPGHSVSCLSKQSQNLRSDGKHHDFSTYPFFADESHGSFSKYKPLFTHACVLTHSPERTPQPACRRQRSLRDCFPPAMVQQVPALSEPFAWCWKAENCICWFCVGPCSTAVSPALASFLFGLVWFSLNGFSCQGFSVYHGCPETYTIDQPELELRGSAASVSGVLE